MLSHILHALFDALAVIVTPLITGVALYRCDHQPRNDDEDDGSDAGQDPPGLTLAA